MTPIGYEAFVFFVNAGNPVKQLTIEQIQGIYSGTITDWETVGGARGRIQAFQRPENSGSQTALEQLMRGHTIKQPITEEVVSGMEGIIRQTANYRNHGRAIGYSFLFYAVSRANDDNPNVQKMLDWIVSAQGQDLIQKTGYTPLEHR